MGILALTFILPTPSYASLAMLVSDHNVTDTTKKLMENGAAVNGWLALVGVLAGGAITKIIDRYFAVHERKIRSEDDRRKELAAEESGFRTELRGQITDMRKELQETRLHVGDLQTMVDEWRDKYYQNVAENLELNSRYTKLQQEYQELLRRHEELSTQYKGLDGLRKQYDDLQSRFDELTRRVREAGVEI